MALWALFALTGATTALVGIPIAPALFELHKRNDATPLPTSRHDGKIANFAEVFASRLAALRPQLEHCVDQHRISRVRLDSLDVLLVGVQNLDLSAELTNTVCAVMGSDSLSILPAQVIEADVCAEGFLRLQPKAVLRAGMSEKNVILEQDSTVLRWLHARGSIFLHSASSAYGRLSAECSIHLQPGCLFQQMHAPQIHTTEAENSWQGVGTACRCFSTPPKCHICEIAANHQSEIRGSEDIFASYRRRIRHQGDFILPLHQTLNANVISTGTVRFGLNSRFMGSTKSYKDMMVDEGACIHGSLVCGGTLYLGEHCSVTGPIMAEEDVVIASGVRVGRPDSLTTIAARNIKIATGCQLHGTVWARVKGIVEN